MDRITNPYFLFDAINQRADLFQLATDDLKANQDFILKAIESQPSIVKYISEELRKNSDFALKAIEKNYKTMKYFSEKLKKDEEFIKAALKIDHRICRFLNSIIKQNRFIELFAEEYKRIQLLNSEFMAKVVRQSAFRLCQLVEGDDEHIVISEILLRDPEFLIKVLEDDRGVMDLLSEELKNNFAFMLRVVKLDYSQLDHTFDLSKNKAFVAEAIKVDFRTFQGVQYLHDGDQELIDLAEAQKQKQTHDLEFMLEAVKNDDRAFSFLKPEFKNNPDFMLELIKEDYKDIKEASDELKNNSDFMLKAFDVHPKTLKYALVDTDEFRGKLLQRVYKLEKQPAHKL
jgi:hypothetical protein